MGTTATMSGQQFDALPYEEGRRWELVSGDLIPSSVPTPEHQLIVQRIVFALMQYLLNNPRNGIVLSDVEFALSNDSRVRPDVLWLCPDKADNLDVGKVPVLGSPDIAVEVISPSERAAETQEKLQTYLQYGTREVWQVYPKTKTVLVHGGEVIRQLGVESTLETPLLAGFSLQITAIF